MIDVGLIAIIAAIVVWCVHRVRRDRTLNTVQPMMPTRIKTSMHMGRTIFFYPRYGCPNASESPNDFRSRSE